MYAFLCYCAIGHKCHLGVLTRKLELEARFQFQSPIGHAAQSEHPKLCSIGLRLIYWETNVSLQTFLFPSKFLDKNTFPK